MPIELIDAWVWVARAANVGPMTAEPSPREIITA
jgi:hypothetical protein